MWVYVPLVLLVFNANDAVQGCPCLHFCFEWYFLRCNLHVNALKQVTKSKMKSDGSLCWSWSMVHGPFSGLHRSPLNCSQGPVVTSGWATFPTELRQPGQHWTHKCQKHKLHHVLKSFKPRILQNTNSELVNMTSAYRLNMRQTVTFVFQTTPINPFNTSVNSHTVHSHAIEFIQCMRHSTHLMDPVLCCAAGGYRQNSAYVCFTSNNFPETCIGQISAGLSVSL